MTNKFIISFIILIMSIFSCSDNSYEIKTNLSNSYACENFKLNSEQLYGLNKHHTFLVRLVRIGDDTINGNRLKENLRQFGDQFNISFQIGVVDIVPICGGTVSYLKTLEQYHTPGYITMVVFCDSIAFTEEKNEKIQGAALGVPTLEDPTLGKPVLCIRSSVLYTKVLHHEIAHLFSLQHTFKDYDYNNKGLNCNSYIGDGQPDTVTPLRVGSVGAKSCKYYAPQEALKDYTDAEIENMVQNPMSYSSPQCLGVFEESQVEKLRKMIEVNSRLQDCIVTLVE